jgi:hypothetical protein
LRKRHFCQSVCNVALASKTSQRLFFLIRHGKLLR